MADATISADLRNPGQVFACLGLMEAAAVLVGTPDRPAAVVGGYACAAGMAQAQFTIESPGGDDPVAVVVRFLAGARVEMLAPLALPLALGKVDVHVLRSAAHDFPFAPPKSPAALPARLRGTVQDGSSRVLAIYHWGDTAASGRDNVKFWAGSGGYPGAGLARDAVQALLSGTGGDLAAATADPWAIEARMTSSFRFDWRRDYVPLDAGFSPNAHKTYAMVGYPLVELLAAIGLQHARPERVDKLNYRYAVSTVPLPLPLSRAVLGGQTLGFPGRTFRMRLGWPGQEGQARCILDAQEESIHD